MRFILTCVSGVKIKKPPINRRLLLEYILDILFFELGVTVAEFIYATCCINQFNLTGVKWVRK